MKKIFFAFIIFFCVSKIFAQSQFSGDLQVNSEFYQPDSVIGATGTPHYDNLKSGLDVWLQLNYQNPSAGLEAGLRLDIFNNSNLHDPGVPYTDQGIGKWYIAKTLNAFKITGGYIYEQFGSGLVYRSYEERPLGIDNALFGLELEYNINENWNIKALAGQQKNLFDSYNPVLKGVNINGFIPFSDSSIIKIAPGASFLNRTIDEDNMNLIAAAINNYDLEDRFVPKYNMYAGSVYNTLTIKNISWYIEYAMKTHEAIKNASGNLIDTDGNVIYTTLAYSQKGFGITGQFRKANNWVLRTSPNELLLDGIMNYLPALTKQNSLRLTARYQDVAQELGETAYQFNVTYTPKKGYTITANYSDAVSADNIQLWREAYIDLEIRKSKYKLLVGAQYVLYNQKILEAHPLDTTITPITPFTEFTYKFDKKKSLRIELQYQNNDGDYGSWIYGLAEFNIAPKWSFTASDMYNFDPLKTDKALHFPLIAAVYTQKANRFSLSYVKQLEGIVCTGGVCRFEPAFSGLKFQIISTF
ncbi:MAG: hypothetical protein H7Y00_02965 [Fimbriimonadaceae bacterium]|nr:hypothetical protein [Chitinophagales bacterium]